MAGTPTNFSEVSICNTALSYLGITEQIQSLTEKSKSGIQCGLHYPRVRDSLMRSYAWPWLEKFIALAPSTDPTLPDNGEQYPGWMYAYGYPADCLYARQVCDSGGVRMRFVQQDALYYDLLLYMPPQIPFKVVRSQDGQSKIILCDIQNAYLLYTQAVSDPAQFDADFATALSARMAMEMAAGLRVDAQFVQGARAAFLQAVNAAQSMAANEALEDPEPPARAIQARL